MVAVTNETLNTSELLVISQRDVLVPVEGRLRDGRDMRLQRSPLREVLPVGRRPLATPIEMVEPLVEIETQAGGGERRRGRSIDGDRGR